MKASAKGTDLDARDFTLHEAQGDFDYFPLDAAAKFLKAEGKNVIAIEGHNASLNPSFLRSGLI